MLQAGVLALIAVIILLFHTIYYRTDIHHVLNVLHQNHDCAIGGNNDNWVNFSTDIFRLYVYSAFYDDRPSLLSDPVIRIIAISDPFENLIAPNVTRLYCILRNGTKTVVSLMIDTPKAIGYGWELNRRNAQEYIYTCPLVKGMIPNTVAISTTQDENSSTCVPVTVPKKPEIQRDFCICPQAAYGLRLDPNRLIEWLEVQKLLGVNLVGIYILSASDSVVDVFKHYVAEGFVEVREMSYIYSSVNDPEKEFWLHLTPAINDCIYRHMYEFRRIVVIDFDEIIMPRNQQNLSDLVTYLDRMETDNRRKNVNYAFRNNYFFLELPPDETISPYLTLLRYRRKVQVSPEGYSVKSIINPQACTHMHNHYCWGLTASYSKYGNTASVDPEIALNQHYKNCHFSRETCDAMLRNSTQDDVMLRLQDILTRNVQDKIRVITGNEV